MTMTRRGAPGGLPAGLEQSDPTEALYQSGRVVMPAAEVPGAQVKDIPVLETIVGGEGVYRR